MTEITGRVLTRDNARRFARLVRRIGVRNMWSTDLPSRLYKYVDRAHAGTVGRGSVKIGTFMGYRNDHSTRGDSMEGMAIVRPNSISLKRGEGEDYRRGMAQMGMHCLGDIEIHGLPGSIQFRHAGQDWYCFCLSTVPDSPSLHQEADQVVYEIRDVMPYMHSFMQGLNIPLMYVGHVLYQDRVFTAFDQLGSKSDDPFIKSKVSNTGYPYEQDCEYRFIIPMTTDLRTSPYPEKPKLARYLRPVI